MSELVARVTQPLGTGRVSSAPVSRETTIRTGKGQQRTDLISPVMMNARFRAGSKYLTVVSRVEENALAKSTARSGSLRRAVMSLMTCLPQH